MRTHRRLFSCRRIAVLRRRLEPGHATVLAGVCSISRESLW